MKRRLLFVLGCCLGIVLFGGWGSTGHKIISKKTADAFPEEMKNFRSWSTFLASHASDADYRKDSDPTEEFRHYIDIDIYDEFLQNGRISQSLDSMNMLHGAQFVNEQGILPWAIIKWTDSLTALFRARKWDMAMQVAADIGHYVGDAHMPLHITNNYNGQLTNQTGVHSRYESTMIGNVQAQLVFTPAVCSYVNNVPDFVFGFIYENYKCVDSVLKADSISKARNGSYSTKYYDTLWARTKYFTLNLLQKAAERHAAIIYTAWKNAGSPDTVTAIFDDVKAGIPASIEMYAYPNPFNNEAKISVNIPNYKYSTVGNPLFRLYNTAGSQVMSVIPDAHTPGSHSFSINCAQLSSGMYFGVFTIGGNRAVTKLMLLK